jgi:hypothetical protein
MGSAVEGGEGGEETLGSGLPVKSSSFDAFVSWGEAEG